MTPGGERGCDRTHRAHPLFFRRLALATGMVLLFVGFLALGTWQLYRLQWKLALIDRVNHRVHAAPVAAPGPRQWSALTAAADAYRHVRVTGTFLYDRTTPVQAVTALGSGFWLLTPLKRADGTLVLINRGYVPAAVGEAIRRNPEQAVPPLPVTALQAPATITGLLRMSEPGGAFLHHNLPAQNRWYSRDVAAIAAARGLSHIAPYFIDADAAPEPVDNTPGVGASGRPVGGLTVIHFRNSHLSYALTWYTLALMVAGAGLWVIRDERRLRQDTDAAAESGDGDKEDGG